jgi:hypothetical protein
MGAMRAVRLALAAALLAGGAGCDRDDTVEQPTCAGSVDAAADEIEVADQLRGLDEALLWCGSYDAYVAELAGQAGLIGYSPQTYVKLRCTNLADARLRDSPTCRVANPPTTPPAVTTPDLVYAAATLDGRVIELRPSDAVPFRGDVPAVVQDTVDIAVSQGCPGVIAQRDLWAGRATTEAAEADPASGLSPADIASAYAQHAIHVALWIGCAGAELAPPATPPATIPPATSGPPG